MNSQYKPSFDIKKYLLLIYIVRTNLGTKPPLHMETHQEIMNNLCNFLTTRINTFSICLPKIFQPVMLLYRSVEFHRMEVKKKK